MSSSSSVKLTIGLDLRPTEPGFKAHFGRGTWRYVSELVRRLVPSQGEVSDGADFPVRLLPVSAAELRPSIGQQRLLDLFPLGKHTVETQLLLPRRMRILGIQMMHFFAHGDAPGWPVVPTIVTVLDLIPLRFPELYCSARSNWRFRLARHLELSAVRNAVGVIAISEATRRDLIEILGVSPADVVVTPLAVGEEFSARDLSSEGWQEDMRRKRLEFGFVDNRPLLLYVGGIDPRKNVLFLIKLFAELLKNAEQQERPLLVLAGNYEQDEQYPLLLEAIRSSGIERDVILLGFVSAEKLPFLYQSADILLFPSLYEGFGLPVLEAMSCGVPVIAGENSSIPEVVGGDDKGGAILLPDCDVPAWVKETREVLASPQRRRLMGIAGVKRASYFSWTETARKTLEAYRYFAQRLRP